VQIVFEVKNSCSKSLVTNESLQAAVAQARNSQKKHEIFCVESWMSNFNVTQAAKSDTMGLFHLHRTCTGAGGSIDLSVADDNVVTCTILLPAQLIPQRSNFSNENIHEKDCTDILYKPSTLMEESRMPNGCKVVVIDDSSVGLFALFFCCSDYRTSNLFAGFTDFVQRVLENSTAFTQGRYVKIASCLSNLTVLR
jgi:hypothetical protein